MDIHGIEISIPWIPLVSCFAGGAVTPGLHLSLLCCHMMLPPDFRLPPDALQRALEPNNVSSLVEEHTPLHRVVSRLHSGLPITVTAIGQSMDTHNDLTARVFERLTDMRLLGVAQGPSGCSLSMVLQPSDAQLALERIHQLVLEG